MNSSISPIEPKEADKLARQFKASWEPPAPEAAKAAPTPVTSTSSQPVAFPKRRIWPWATAVSVLAISVGAFAIYSLRPADPESGKSGLAVTPAPTEATDPTHAQLQVLVTPETAELFVDGKKVQTPFSAKVARNTRHIIKARAPGYQQELMSVSVNGDRQVQLRLQPGQDAPIAGGAFTQKSPYADNRPDEPSALAQPPAKPEVEMANVLVRTQPRQATLYVDGNKADNPYSSSVEVGNQIHLRVTASGYDSEELTLSVDKPMVRLIRLKKTKSQPATQPRPVVKRSKPKPAAPTAGPKPGLVTDNPY